MNENTFEIEGVHCKLGTKEFWGTDTQLNVYGTSIYADIKDRLDKTERLVFTHTYRGSAFQGLFTYLKKLVLYSTHDAVKELNKKDRLLLKKEEEIQKLKAKLLNAGKK